MPETKPRKLSQKQAEHVAFGTLCCLGGIAERLDDPELKKLYQDTRAKLVARLQDLPDAPDPEMDMDEVLDFDLSEVEAEGGAA